jgi:uncharacterized SAM-binding protein YcdF (DUF218 family)
MRQSNLYGPHMREDFKKFMRISRFYLGVMLIIVGLFFMTTMEATDFLGYGLITVGLTSIAFFYFEWLEKRRPRLGGILANILRLLVVVITLAFIFTESLIVNVARTDPDPGADYLIVLGAGVNGTVPSVSLRDRLERALSYLAEYPEAVCIVTGGQGPGEDMTEAACMARYLTQGGIDPARIIQEERARNTYENIQFSYEIIERDNQGARVAVLTAEYHLYRARLIADRMGFAPAGVAARTSIAPVMVNYFIRECFAVWRTVITGR